MKYFTKQLWQSWQLLDRDREAADREWADILERYQREVAALRDRMDSSSFEFFTEAAVHDGHLTGFHFVPYDVEWDGSTERRFPVNVELEVREESDLAWVIRYGSVRRVLFDYPSESPLFLIGGEGLGDWGYHELSDAGAGYLRHEVLFSTGSTLLVEFARVAVSSIPPREAAV